MTLNQPYDVFLSHSHADAEWVEQLADKLTDQAGLAVWLDKWVLTPGNLWQVEMARGLFEARACLVCISDRTPDGWFQLEIQRALNRKTQNPEFRVIPLLLPGAQEERVGAFLELLTWVDLRTGLEDQDAFERLVAGIQGRKPGRGSGASAAPPWLPAWDVALDRYRARIQKRYADLRVLGHPQPVPLEGVFTDVYLLDTPSALRRFDLDQLLKVPSWLEPEQQKRIGGLDLVRQPTARRLFILGKPGAGKTTFMRYLALQAAQGALDAVPILISLREWSDSGRTLRDHLAEQFVGCGLPRPGDCLDRLLESGRALVLFDGLDEVNRKGGQSRRHDRGAAIAALKAFGERYLDCQCLITCRVAATYYQFEGYSYVELADFSDEQIESYVRKWFAGKPAKGERFLADFGRDEHRGLRELGSNPLLLSMLCLAFDETMRFPQRQADLYKQALDVLLTKWDAARGIVRDEIYRRLSPERKQQMLARIAAESFERGEVLMRGKDLERQIAAYLERLPPADAQSHEIDGSAVLRAIEAQHSILVERAMGIHSFAHLTFHEYYTARYIVDNEARGTLEQLIEHHLTDDRWRVVFLLTASLLDNAELFFDRFATALDAMVQSKAALLKLMSTIQKVTTPGGETREPVRDRSPIFLYILDRALDIAGDLVSDLDRDLDRDIGFDHDLDLARSHACDLVLALRRTRTIALDHALALDHARTLFVTHVRACALGLARALYRTLALDLARERDLVRARALVHNEATIQILIKYLAACQLYVDCLDVAYVSDRAGLRDRLLRVPGAKTLNH